jgi:hypothetical protein
MGLMLHTLLIDVFQVHEPNLYYYNAMTLYTPCIVLQQPTSPQAVQIIGENSFQMCWDYPMSVLQQGSYYHVLNSQYAKVDQMPYNQRNLSFSNVIFGQHSNINHSYVFIQVVPSATMQDLPSRPIRVDISGQYNKRDFDTFVSKLYHCV